jgi:hypothetical protein
MNTEVHYRVQKLLPSLSFLYYSIQSTLSHVYPPRSILILSAPVSLVFQVVTSLKKCRSKVGTYLSFLLCVQHAHSSHSPEINHPNNIKRGAKIMNSLLRFTFMFKYSPQHFVVKHPQCSSPRMEDRVSDPHKARGKIIVLYVLIF